MLSATQHSHSGPPDFRGPSFTCAPHRRPSLLAIHHSWTPLPSVPGSPGSWPLASVCSASGGGLTGALACPLTAFSARQPGAWLLLRALVFEEGCRRPHGEHRMESLHALAWPPQLWGPSRGLLVGGWGRLPKVTCKVATGLGLNPSYMCSSSQYCV